MKKQKTKKKTSPEISKATRDLIVAQALSEIEFDRRAKSVHYGRFHANEDLYYNKKVQPKTERANVNLNEGQSFVQTFLSKINTPYSFRYARGEESDLQAAKIVNAIKDKDAKDGNWDEKITDARTQLIIYGRYILEYHADSTDGYKSHLSNVDVYQFLIDPSCGGQDIEKAYHCGRGGILKSKKQLEKGAKSGAYLSEEVEALISGTGNANEQSEEDRESENRYISILSQARILDNPGVFKFWEWYTTYEGERYYLLLCEKGGKAVRVEKMKEIFESEKFPFVTVAAYPDLTEFWTPAPLDGVRDPILAKNVAINQMLDNAEAINKPMKGVDTNAVEDIELLKYRRDGTIPFKKGTNIQQALQFFPVVPLTTSLQVYDKLGAIIDTQGGVNAGAKGNSEEDKVGIYEGNQANAADRFALIRDSEARGQRRFAMLYLAGLEEHMTGKVAVEMIGLDGTQFKEVEKKDIKRGQSFDIVVITTGSEETMEQRDKENKLSFISSNKGNPLVNQKVLIEAESGIVGFTTDETKALLNTEYGEAEVLAEAARDIMDIVGGKKIQPNQIANLSYAQKIVDYLRDNEENLKPATVKNLLQYLDDIQNIIQRNMSNSVNDVLSQE